MIDPNSDLKFELEILECSIAPDSLKQAHPPAPMVPFTCFYIVSAGPKGKGSNLAIGVASEDAYAPATTGIYNIALEEWAGLR